MDTDTVEREALAADLKRMLEDVIGSSLPLDRPGAASASVWQLGLTSAGYLELLVAIEREFAIAWTLDEPAEAFASFDSLVDHVMRKRREKGST
jgi:acyl carrier protein